MLRPPRLPDLPLRRTAARTVRRPAKPLQQCGETPGRRDDYVLLALTSDSESDMRGHIFGVCTLSSLCRPTTKIINPEVPRERYEDWPEAIAIRELWEVEPIKKYENVANGELAKEAQYQRGKFFQIKFGQEELNSWLGTAKMQRLDLHRSKVVLDHIRHREVAASQ